MQAFPRFASRCKLRRKGPNGLQDKSSIGVENRAVWGMAWHLEISEEQQRF